MSKIALILLFITAISFGQKEEPEDVIAGLLQTHRAVMLGDMNHHQPVYTQNVINVLNSWLDMVSGDSVTHNITLILECGSAISELLNDTINEQNFHEILKYGDDYVSYIEDMECYSGLVSVFSRINRLNAGGRQINLKIKGFEDYEITLKAKTNREGELWFVNVRDSVLGEKISEYMNEYPDEKILIFYGGMHLTDERIDKSIVLQDVGSNEADGYMLAHYLKQRFGDEEVITISQLGSLGQAKDTIVNYDSTYLSLDKTWFVKPFRFISQTPISSLFSRRAIEFVTTSLLDLEKYPEGFKAQNMRSNYINGLNLITGRTLSSTNEVEKWYSSTSYKPFIRIISDDFWTQCFTLLSKYPKLIQLRSAFNKMGFYPGITDTSIVPDSVSWFGEIRKNNTENILIVNSIAMLWIGYPDEKLQAANFLKNETGWVTENPHYYLKWYRKNYFGVDY